MVTQKRYFEYGSRIKSKDSAEPFGLINGIGAIFGFDKISIDTLNSNFIIGSSNDESEPDKNKYLYISDENGIVQNYNHLVVTPDGIITAILDNIELSKPSSTNNEYMLIATHNYIAGSDVESPTLLELIPNNTSSKFSDKINLLNTNINTWYSTIQSWEAGFNKSTSVILAFIDNNDTEPKIYTLFKNSWSSSGSSGSSGSGTLDTILSVKDSSGDTNVSIKNLEYILNTHFSTGSGSSPLILRSTRINNSNTSYKYISFRLMKLGKWIWNIKGNLKYKVNASNLDMNLNYIEPSSGQTIQVADSATATSHTDVGDNLIIDVTLHKKGVEIAGTKILGLNGILAGPNYVLMCKALGLSPIGFTLNNLKTILGLNSTNTLNLIHCNVSLRNLQLSGDMITSSVDYKVNLEEVLDLEIHTSWDTMNSYIIGQLGLNNTEFIYDFDILFDINH